MATYIPKEAALKVVEKYGTTNGFALGSSFALGRHTGLAICIASEIAEIPAADVAPVVRCKDCKFSHADGHVRTCEGYWFDLSGYAVSVKDDAFCSYGERRDDA